MVHCYSTPGREVKNCDERVNLSLGELAAGIYKMRCGLSKTQLVSQLSHGDNALLYAHGAVHKAGWSL